MNNQTAKTANTGDVRFIAPLSWFADLLANSGVGQNAGRLVKGIGWELTGD
jgi:hypothetical protein